MTFERIKTAISNLLPTLKDDFGVQNIGIFGSYARGDAHQTSDIDILVSFKESPGILKFLSLKILLEESIGVSVDLVTEQALRPRLRERILKQVRYVA